MTSSSDPDQPNLTVAQPKENLNNMVAKVTIETPSGSSTKYYLLYRDRCYTISSLGVGAMGGLGVGFYSKVFFEQTRPKKSLKSLLPFKIPEVRLSFKLKGKPISIPILFGNTVWWRVGSRAALGSIVYSFLECQFQGAWYRRSYFDCGLAGALSGAMFGLRGIPGGIQGAGMGAVGFGAFAVVCRLLFH